MSHVHQMAQVTSTNDVAWEMAEQGAPSGTLVLADQQTGGRGRSGRSWFSPPGANVYLSCVHRSQLPVESLSGLTLDVASAIATALEDLVGLKPDLKWPNDVLVDGRKIAGVLTELHVQRTPVVIVGVGLNVNLTAEELPDDLQGTATSLRMATGQTWDTAVVGELLGRRIREKLAGYEISGEPDLIAFTQRYSARGTRARVQGPDGPAEGTILGVMSDGALEVSLDGDDDPWRVRSGEVELLGHQTGGAP